MYSGISVSVRLRCHICLGESGALLAPPAVALGGLCLLRPSHFLSSRSTERAVGRLLIPLNTKIRCLTQSSMRQGRCSGYLGSPLGASADSLLLVGAAIRIRTASKKSQRANLRVLATGCFEPNSSRCASLMWFSNRNQ